MTPIGDLSPRKRRFVAAMMTARTLADAAEEIGVTERTAQRYVADPAVKQAMITALDGALGQVTGQAVAGMIDALATLEAIHQDGEAPASARVSAARAILDAGPKLREALDLAERVQALEAVLQAISDDR